MPVGHVAIGQAVIEWGRGLTATLILGVLTTGCARSERPATPSTSESTPTKVATASQQQSSAAASAESGGGQIAEFGRAKALYSLHCGACHGERGDGQGIAARFLFPKPRNFRAGHFRLVSTANGVPTIADLVTVLGRGMPGSAMPPWPRLSEADQNLLAEQVMAFHRDGIREREKAAAAENAETISEEEIDGVVKNLTTPGPRVEVPPLAPLTPESVVRGREFYLGRGGCTGCHGREAKGDATQKMVDEDGLPTQARDLTRGTFKGSPDPQRLYGRILAGMPGTPMPATKQATPAEIADLVHFVLSLSDEKIRKEAVLNRERIVARVAGELATTPDAEIWNKTDAARIRVTPLWWRNEFPPNVEVRALHDGRKIAVRLQWSDPKEDLHDTKTETFADAVGLELFAGGDEPFLGMGAPGAAMDVWFWDADRQSGGTDVDQVNPRMVVDLYPFSEKGVDTAEYQRPGTRTDVQAKESLTAEAVDNPIVPKPGMHGASTLETAGPGTVTFRPPLSQLVQARGAWKDGMWTVVMTRDLSVSEGQGVSLKPGGRVSLAIAVWDGAARDRDGQKSISIWQDLVLEEPGR